MDIFLEDHGGPGVQHMGLYTPDIRAAISSFKDGGAQFVEPPQAYYEDVGTQNSKQKLNLSINVDPF